MHNYLMQFVKFKMYLFRNAHNIIYMNFKYIQHLDFSY